MSRSEWLGSPDKAKSYLRRVGRETANIIEAQENVTPGEFEKPLTEESWKKEGTFEFVIPSSEMPASVMIHYKSPWIMNRTHIESDMSIPRRSFREITSFVLKRGENSFDLFKDVSALKGRPIYAYINDIQPPPKIAREGGSYNEWSFFTYDDLRSLNGILVLLHEVGHMVKLSVDAQESTKIPFSLGVRRALTYMGSQAVRRAWYMNNERSASAFALGVMRNFVDTPTLQKIQSQLHQFLSTHHRKTGTYPRS